MLKNSISVDNFLLTHDRYEYVKFPNVLEMLALSLKCNLEKAMDFMEQGDLEKAEDSIKQDISKAQKIQALEAFFGLPVEGWKCYKSITALTVFQWLRTRIKRRMQKENIDFFYVYDGKGYDYRKAFIAPTDINNHKFFSIISECVESP